jgi:hypothetical protein
MNAESWLKNEQPRPFESGRNELPARLPTAVLAGGFSRRKVENFDPRFPRPGKQSILGQLSYVGPRERSILGQLS